MQTKQIKLKDVGTVHLVKRPRIKNINIRVTSFKDVKVSIPAQVSFAEAEHIVHGKIEWIKKHQIKMKKLEDAKTVFNENTKFHTRAHRLIINKTGSNQITAKIFKGEINVYYPKELNVSNESVQFMIKKAIEEALRIEAKQHLPLRVKELAEKYNFKYNRLFIKNIKSRWGSCSKKGNINLSLHLMRIPVELIDYVILHELAHTVEHNHSKKFWEVLNSIYGNAKSIDNKLKDYNISVW
ncbi:WLM domain protein [bacterium BMS3Abin03]|nr:WLM domain protein [bacterium BMS3Abin03]